MKTGKIYKLYNQYDVYYGSTTKSLKERLNQHKSGAKNKKCISHILFQDCCIPKIELLEEVEFDDIKELRDREAYYIRNLECINKVIPNRTGKEYRIDNKKQIKQYYLDNKDKKKEYYLDNKDKKKEYQKKYNEVNKKNISEKKRVKMTCECGSVVRKTDIQRHYKSKKHLKYIENSNI